MRKLTLLATMLALVLAMMALSAGPASAQTTNNGMVDFNNTGRINIKATCSNVQLATLTFGNDANRICNNRGNQEQENEFRDNNQGGNTYGNVFLGDGGFFPSYGNTYGNVFLDGFYPYYEFYPYWGYDYYCGCYHYWY